MNNIVRIVDEDGTFHGTGFLLEINNKIFCFTAHHSIVRLDKIFIQSENKQYYATWLGEYSDIDKDIAVLEIKNCPVRPLIYHLQVLPGLNVSICGFSADYLEDFPRGRSVEGKLSDTVSIYRSQRQDTVGPNEWNKYSKIEVNVYEFDGSVYQGFDGAPVLYKEDNNVVGMVVTVLETVERKYCVLIPIQTLLKKFPTKSIESKPEDKIGPSMTQEIDTVKPSTHLTSDAYALVDMLGYGLIVHACYTFLIHKDTKPPLCVSIQSPWGGGKTSFMRMLQEKLDPGSSRFTTARERDTNVEPKMENAINLLKELRDNPKYNIRKPYYTVWFNAWKYHNSEQIWSGLAHAIVTQISEQFGDQKEKFLMDLQRQRIDPERLESLLRNSEAKTWKENLKSHAKYYIMFGGITVATLAVDAMSKGTILSGLGQWGVLISVVGGAVLSAYDRYRSKKEQQILDSQLVLYDLLDVPNYSKKLTTEQQVEQDLTKLFRIIKKNSTKKESRLVIFIDDLDRCSPNHITEVLEALNLFISSEFQNSYFVIGMDPEFVSAAVEESYINVIRRLSPINQKVGMGWNFMNKFIQLPVILPRPEKKNIETYIGSLLLQKKTERANKLSIMGSVEELGTAEKEKFLKGQKIAIEKINETKETYSDHDPKVRTIILDASQEFPNNPREMKRFLNILRFYYFIREGRKAAELPYPSLDQIKRWIILVMKWPQVAVWLQKGVMERENDNPVGDKLLGLEKNIVGDKSEQVAAFTSNKKPRRPKQISENNTDENDMGLWLNDKSLSLFFKNEINIKNKKPEEALSTANEKGLY